MGPVAPPSCIPAAHAGWFVVLQRPLGGREGQQQFLRSKRQEPSLRLEKVHVVSMFGQAQKFGREELGHDDKVQHEL